jgi:hypothetical protein
LVHKDAGLNDWRPADGKVSGSSRQQAASRPSATTKSSRKIVRQSDSVTTQPPTMGAIAGEIAMAEARGWLEGNGEVYALTAQGRNFNNDLVSLFLKG